ncbi:unnamed protein product, partial [Brassica rapa subsp. trilocularis]
NDSPSDDVFPISQPSSSTVILFSGTNGSACSSHQLTKPYPAFLAQKTASTIGSIQYLRVTRGTWRRFFSFSMRMRDFGWHFLVFYDVRGALERVSPLVFSPFHLT